MQKNDDGRKKGKKSKKHKKKRSRRDRKNETQSDSGPQRRGCIACCIVLVLRKATFLILLCSAVVLVFVADWESLSTLSSGHLEYAKRGASLLNKELENWMLENQHLLVNKGTGDGKEETAYGNNDGTNGRENRNTNTGPSLARTRLLVMGIATTYSLGKIRNFWGSLNATSGRFLVFVQIAQLTRAHPTHAPLLLKAHLVKTWSLF